MTPLTPAPAAPSPVPPGIARLIAPDTLRPGTVLSLEGTGFAPLAHDNTLVLRAEDGTVVPAIVEIATSTRLDVRLPVAAAFPCLPSGGATLQLTVAGRVVERPVTLAVARRLALAAGESAPLLGAAASACTELVNPLGSPATYALAVLNTAGSAAATTAITVRANSANSANSANATAAARPVPAPAVASEPAVATEGAHDRRLADQARIIAATGSVRDAWRVAQSRAAAVAAVVAAPAVGSTLTRTILPGACTQSTRVVTRVVYVGTRSVILEDVASPHAGRMDAEFIALGREYDDLMHPTLVASLGDPLALDAAMQGDGRITMLFSSAVPQLAPGVSAFVSACNLYPRRTVAESNEDALFYARTPHEGESHAAWRRLMRSTVMHEAKHLASFAERLAREGAFEEPWLEEATARIAEELYARTFTAGGAWRSNAGWADGLRCEVYQCDGRPLALWKHFPVLHDYLVGVESRTPLGAADADDVTFYASGWSLVRWAADHFGANDEAAFLRALVRGTTGATGVNALSRLAGRPAEELLADWSLAQWLDDRPGFTPRRATLTFPSWNLPDIMQGLSLLDPARYRTMPVSARDISGDRAVTVPALRGWSAGFFETTLTAGGTQLLALRGSGDAALPPTVRLAVVRVQ